MTATTAGPGGVRAVPSGPTPEVWAAARRRVEAGESIRAVARALGVAPSSVLRRSRREAWETGPSAGAASEGTGSGLGTPPSPLGSPSVPPPGSALFSHGGAEPGEGEGVICPACGEGVEAGDLDAHRRGLDAAARRRRAELIDSALRAERVGRPWGPPW